MKEKELRELMEQLAAVEERANALAPLTETSEDKDIEEREAALNQISEERKELEAKIAEVRKELDAAKAVEEGRADITKVEGEKREMKTLEEIRASKEYIEAYARAVKTGDYTEARALLSDNATNGVVPVPTFVAGIVAERLKESEILRRVRKMEAAGNVKVGFEISAPAAGVHEEGDDAIAEEELSLGIVTLVPETLKKWVGISDEALDSMNGEEYLRYIYEEIARGIVKARENKVVAKILAAPGTATATAPAVAAYSNSGTAALDDFIQARALLSSAASELVIIMTPAQYAVYRSLQLSANYAVDPFDGLTVLFNDTVTAPIIGDLNGVLENLPKGGTPVMKLDDTTNMKEDIVNVLGRCPVATEVVGNKYFAKVTA